MSVSTTMTIRDRMTSRLNKITQAYNKTTRAARAADAATKEVNPGASFERAETPITRAGKKVQEFSRSQTQAAAGAEKVKSAWSGVGGYIRSAMAALGVKKAVELTLGGALNLDDMEREFQARLGNDGAGSALFNHLKEQAKTSAFGLEELAKNTSSFMSMTTNPKNIDGLNAIAEKLAIFDKTGQGLEGAGFSLKEAMSGDIVSLAERFNMSKAQIRAFKIDKLGKSGDVEGFIEQFNKLLEAQNMGEEAYQRMLQSPKRQLSMFLSNMKTGFADAGKSALEALTPLIMKLNGLFASPQAEMFFNTIGQGLAGLATGFANAAAFISDNWNQVYPFILGGLIVLGAVAVASGVKATIAWLGVMWPFLLAAAIIGLIIWKLREMGFTFEEIAAGIGTVLGGLYAFGYNLVADAYNLLCIFAEFFANFLDNPVIAIFRLFWKLADFVLGIIETIANAIDAVFGSSLASAVGGWRSGLKNTVDDLFGKERITFTRMEKIDTGETARSWGKSGAQLVSSMSSLEEAVDNGDWFGAGGIDNVGTVDEVGKVKEDVSISDEDLKFMRDVAEMRYTQNFVTLTPTVSMNASISEKVDVNDVIGGIEYQLENEFALAAEGVYN